MKSIYIIFIIFLSTFTISSCSETIPLDNVYEPQILVTGIFSESKTGYVFVDIQETVPVGVLTKKSINTAKVSLYTKGSGIPETKIENLVLLNDENGKYKSENELNPIIGNYYWLKIILEDGTVIESIPELFNAPVNIKSITKDAGNTRVTFSDSLSDSSNFYLIRYRFYDIDGNFFSQEFTVLNNTLFKGNEDAFSEIEDTYYSSIEIEISKISFNTYRFFKNYDAQKEAQEVEGDDFFSQLFAAPPANLEGNIINRTTGKKVLGFFEIFNSTIKKQDFK